jgi:hypothetical protein
MKKHAFKGITLLLVIILFVPFVGFAQDKDDPNIVTAVTLTFDTDADGSPAEFDSLYALFDENVLSKNKFIKSVMRVGHYYGSSSGEFVIITEYNDSGLGIIEKAGDETADLFKKWKKDEDDRAEFNKARNKYFKPRHSDEIYTLLSKVSN